MKETNRCSRVTVVQMILAPDRGEKSEVREDDTNLVLACRMAEYREKTLPVTDFCDTRGILARLHSGREAGPVFDDLSRLIIE